MTNHLVRLAALEARLKPPPAAQAAPDYGRLTEDQHVRWRVLSAKLTAGGVDALTAPEMEEAADLVDTINGVELRPVADPLPGWGWADREVLG